MVRVQRERLVSSLPVEPLEDGRVGTSRPFHSAMAARRKAEQRARRPRRPTRMAYPPPLSRVMDALRRGWTPKRIEGRLKVEWSADPCIPMRVPIAERPKRVDSRRGFGHFESGTVVGTAPSKRCIDTQAERKSRRLFARFKSALATARAEYDIYNRIPAPARIDRTWDNGTEWIGYNVLNSPMRDE